MSAASELVVVKLGGTTLADEHATLAGVARLAADRRFVVVHGGGRRLTDWLARLGIESRFERGRRLTDDATLEVALAVLGGLVNGELVAELRRLGAPAVGLTGIDGGLLRARRLHELGRVGRVVGATPTVLYALLAADQLPVIASLALDESGEICNVNADEAAAGLAGTLAARLVLLTDSDGVQDGSGRRIDRLDELSAEQLISEGTISGGMLPKVQAALAVVRSGGPAVVIADGRAGDALERALSDPAFGTRVSAAG
jgi:acetylglutamate kinase